MGAKAGIGAASLVFAAMACGGETTPSAPTPQPPVTYALEAQAYTTLQAVWAPEVPSPSTAAAIEAGDISIYDHDAFADLGLGVRRDPGIPWQERTELDPAFMPGAPEARRSLVYLWQAADPQLIDEESPIRFEGFEALYRPQGHLTPQVFEAHVRSARRISELSGRPFDFALVAGDLTDGSQENELAWVFDILSGGTIDPDSGVDDDPVPGPGNDFNDPFLADGLGVDWYAAIGNHETLYNGGFGILNEAVREAAVGDAVYTFPLFQNGFRDGARPDAPVVTEGTTPADPKRLVLNREEVLQLLHDAPGAPEGHGLSAEAPSMGVGYFSVHPIPGKPIRLITLNTVHSSPSTAGVGALGHVDQAQFDWLDGELTAADVASELVIVMSHHRAADFWEGSPVSGAQLSARLRGCEGLALHVAGHGHANTITEHAPTSSSERGYWELMLASTVDFPMQSRILELVDEGNGHLSIYATNLGHNAPEDSLAHEARRLAAAKRAFGDVTDAPDVAAFWSADTAAQNLLLRVPLPTAVQAELARHDWPTRVESEATLLELDGP